MPAAVVDVACSKRTLPRHAGVLGRRITFSILILLVAGCSAADVVVPDPPAACCAPEPRVRATRCRTNEAASICVDELAHQPASLIFFRPTTRWGRTTLTWTLVNRTESLSDQDQLRQAARAMARWAVETPLTFQFVNGEADIAVSFEPDFHGDPLFFDGAGGIRGHAFFPGSARPGEIHLDAEENWGELLDDGKVLLFPVLLHLVGHALGLEHSLDEDAIMAPTLRRDRTGTLSRSDVEAIRLLYGSADGLIPPVPIPRPPEFSVPPPNPDSLDDPDFDLDGIPDTLEVFALGTDPFFSDTDGDGASDFEEVFLLGTSPVPIDTAEPGRDGDEDGLPDIDEVSFIGSDPGNADSDGDGASDAVDPFPTNPLFGPESSPPRPVGCLSDEDCRDGLFCNGREVCASDGGCVRLPPPCGTGLTCNEKLNRCEALLSCESNLDCDDKDCSNGVETCAEGQCLGGVPGQTLVLFDFETVEEPDVFLQSSGFRIVTRRRTRVLELNWSLDETGGRDAFVVLFPDPVRVTPCDRLLADIEVAGTQRPRLEAKLAGGQPVDTASRSLVPDLTDPIDTVEVVITGRYLLSEIAVVIEHDIHSGSGTLWVDNVRLIRGH